MTTKETWEKWGTKVHSSNISKKRILSAQKPYLTPKSIYPNEGIAYFYGFYKIFKTSLNYCQCVDFHMRKAPCKHIYRLAMSLNLFAGTPVDKHLRIRSFIFNIISFFVDFISVAPGCILLQIVSSIVFACFKLFYISFFINISYLFYSIIKIFCRAKDYTHYSFYLTLPESWVDSSFPFYINFECLLLVSSYLGSVIFSTILFNNVFKNIEIPIFFAIVITFFLLSFLDFLQTKYIEVEKENGFKTNKTHNVVSILKYFIPFLFNFRLVLTILRVLAFITLYFIKNSNITDYNIFNSLSDSIILSLAIDAIFNQLKLKLPKNKL